MQNLQTSHGYMFPIFYNNRQRNFAIRLCNSASLSNCDDRFYQKLAWRVNCSFLFPSPPPPLSYCLSLLTVPRQNLVIPHFVVLQLFLSSPRPTLRFAAVRTLNKVAMTQPASVASCNLDLENLITDVNRSIATLAITTLLKVRHAIS